MTGFTSDEQLHAYVARQEQEARGLVAAWFLLAIGAALFALVSVTGASVAYSAIGVIMPEAAGQESLQSVMRVLFSLAVPLFFIAGHLYLMRAENEVMLAKFINRAALILLPFFIIGSGIFIGTHFMSNGLQFHSVSAAPEDATTLGELRSVGSDWVTSLIGKVGVIGYGVALIGITFAEFLIAHAALQLILPNGGKVLHAGDKKKEAARVRNKHRTLKREIAQLNARADAVKSSRQPAQDRTARMVAEATLDARNAAKAILRQLDMTNGRPPAGLKGVDPSIFNLDPELLRERCAEFDTAVSPDRIKALLSASVKKANGGRNE